MLALLPTLLLVAVQRDGPAPAGHAALHSRDVQLYLELPDLPRAREAYGEASLVRLLNDPDLARAIEELSGEPFEPKDLAEGALEGLGGLESAVLDVLDGLSAASLSFGGLEREPDAGAPPWSGLHARLVLDFADEGSAEAAAALAARLEGPGGVERAEAEGGADLALASVPGAVLQHRRSGKRLALLLRAEGSPAAAYAGADVSVETPLADDERYRTFAAAAGEPKGVPVWNGFTSLDRDALDRLAQRLGNDPLSDLEHRLVAWLLPVGRLAWSTTLDAGTFRTHSVRPAGGEARAVDATFLEALPADAIGAWAATFDAEAVLEDVDAHLAPLAGDLGDRERGGWREAFREKAGLDLERDLLAHLGSTLFLYLEPIESIGPPKLRAYVELKDAEAFSASLSKLLARLGESFPGEVEVSTREYRGVPLTSLRFAQLEGAAMMQPTPTFAVVEGRLLVTLNGVHARREIKRLAEAREARGAEGGEAPAASSHPVLAELTGEPIVSLGYLDWPALIDGVYGLVKAAAGLFGGMAGPGVPDLSALPPIEVVTRHFHPSRSVTTRRGAFDWTRTASPFGPEAVLVAGGVPGAALTFQAGPALEAEPFPPAELPEASQLEEATRVRTTVERLRALRTGLAVYRLEHGELPRELSALAESTESFPDGFVAGEDAFVDGWGRPFRYERTADGHALYSVGPDGIDQGGGEGDLTAGGP